MTEFRIRPSARLIKTIGKDLVKDKFSAIVELVKNSFDADSPVAHVEFDYSADRRILKITVSDKGSGMDLDTVVNHWLVPATSDKLDRKVSTKGRPLQGRKGIGRFAAAALGDMILLETRARGKKDVSVLLDVAEFSTDKLLEDVPIIVNESDGKGPIGTRIEVSQSNLSLEEVTKLWGQKQRSKLAIELSKLMAPSEVMAASKALGHQKQGDEFSISLRYIGMPEVDSSVISIKPFNVIELYDYRISGIVDDRGNASLTFSNQNLPKVKPEKISAKFFLDEPEFQSYPGKIRFDFMVFDRDPQSIEELINRGLKDPFSGEKVGKLKARQILNEYYGVSLFRGQFRIRPYGDKDFDWLELDKKRVQNPSMKIGHNQVIGMISVQSEEESGLEEKSARDGLVEDSHYEGLKHVLTGALLQLEERRFAFRQKSFRGRSSRTVDDRLEDLFDFQGVRTRVSKRVSSMKLGRSAESSIKEIIDGEIEQERERKEGEYRSIRETIALYQGQVTLGKITHVLLHEGRKHIKVISETPDRLLKWVTKLSRKFDESIFEKLQDRSQSLVNSAKALALLFRRIEPLAITRRPKRKSLELRREVESAFEIFGADLKRDSIHVELDVPKSVHVYATPFDLATIFANLIENSIYWLSISSTTKPKICVESTIMREHVQIEFLDNGPGFQGSNMELMFEPGYSMKRDGTGLGLSLVGESVKYLEGSVEAVVSEEGASFIIKLRKA